MKVLSRVLTWIFLSCYIRHSFTIPMGHCPYCTQMALLGIRHRDIVRGHDSYLPSRICLRPRLVLVLQTPLFRGSPWSYGRKDKCGTFPRVSLGEVFSGGVRSNEPRNLICPLGHCPTNTCSLLSGIPYSRAYLAFVTVVYPRFPLEPRLERSKCSTFPRVSLGEVLKRGQSAVDVPCRPVTSGGTVFCSLCLILPPIFLEGPSELRKKGLSTTLSRVLSRSGVGAA